MMPDSFEHNEKMDILRILEQEVIIANRKEYVNNAIELLLYLLKIENFLQNVYMTYGFNQKGKKGNVYCLTVK